VLVEDACTRKRGFLRTILDGGLPWLTEMWKGLAKLVPDEPALAWDGLGLDIEAGQDGTTLVMVTMPEATRMNESHVVGFVFPPPRPWYLFFLPEPVPLVRCLEFSRDPDDERTLTFLCGWQSIEGRLVHQNFGSSPLLDRNGFLELLRTERDRLRDPTCGLRFSSPGGDGRMRIE